ncbi:MAG TPA: nuclear transport factor 2 family protein [Puia sp.]|nr:nuclear transport factor 2 family protein [Puia sp.]
MLKSIKHIFFIVSIVLGLNGCSTNNPNGSSEDQAAFRKTKEAIREGFAKGDVEAVLALHHPDVMKYFGGKNIVSGREGLRKQLTDIFKYAKVEFVQNDVETTVFNGDAVIETCLYGIKTTPKNGDSARIFYGRSMVVYVKYKESPTGWASIREMTQEGPEK